MRESAKAEGKIGLRGAGKFRKVGRPEEGGSSGWQLSSSWHNVDDDISSSECTGRRRELHSYQPT